MNKYKLFLAYTASLFLMSSCYDLDRYPEGELSSGTFFQTQDHADQAMMGVYSMMTDDDVFGVQFGFDCLGGVSSGYDGAAYPNIMHGTYTTTEGTVSNKYKKMYEGISRANIILQNVDNCDMSDELKTQYKGEAKFMRALYYSELLNYFGGVSIYDETTVVAEEFMNMTKKRNTAEEVREFILKDLDNAIAALPAEGEWDSSNKGRATSGAAMALKGKVLLYNKQYAEAAVCFESVINSGRYELYPDYGNLFKPEGDESSEMIFAVQNIGGVGMDYGIPSTFYMGSRSAYGSCWNNVMAATDFVDSYEWKDGRPFDWNEIIPGFNDDDEVKKKTFYATLNADYTEIVAYPESKDKLLEMYEQRDPRMMASIILPYTWFKGWYANANKDCEYVLIAELGKTNEQNGFIRVNGNYEMYLWRKFVAEYDMNGAINNRADTPINFPIIRYADVLLMLAECYNENNQPDQAVELINQVRNRVDMPGLNSGPAYLQATTKEQIFERIKHERAVELAAEGHSFNDMKRWGLLETLNGEVKGFTGQFYYNRVVRDRDYLWPIPQDEMDRNDNMTQNPGWG